MLRLVEICYFTGCPVAVIDIVVISVIAIGIVVLVANGNAIIPVAVCDLVHCAVMVLLLLIWCIVVVVVVIIVVVVMVVVVVIVIIVIVIVVKLSFEVLLGKQHMNMHTPQINHFISKHNIESLLQYELVNVRQICASTLLWRRKILLWRRKVFLYDRKPK